MPPNLEEKATQCLVAANLPIPLLAEKMGLPEPELRTLCHHGDPRFSEMKQVAHCLRVLTAYFLGPVTQASIGNTQNIKIGKAAAHQLASQLSTCQRAFHAINQLVAAKEETITLLRAGHNRPN